MKSSKIDQGRVLQLDSYQVKQYENERIVDEVEVLEPSSARAKWVLVYSPKLMANILVPKSDLTE